MRASAFAIFLLVLYFVIGVTNGLFEATFHPAFVLAFCLRAIHSRLRETYMKSENWTRMRAASAAGVCLAMLFITCGARAQETKETVTVNDVDRTYIVRLPKGYDRERKYPVVILLHGMGLSLHWRSAR
jgi:hypothetical protein